MNRSTRMGALVLATLAPLGLQAATFSLVTLRSDGTPPSNYSDGSQQPAITPNGRYVVFTASATNLVTPDATGRQVYLRDRVAGTTELISVSTSGGEGNGFSETPTVSDDGCRVVFTSSSTNLVASDTNSVRDVFVRNRCTAPATTSLVSVSTAGVQGNAESLDGRISGDGSKVALVSHASNLAAATGSTFSALYLRDLNAGTTVAITALGARISGNGPDLSRDGSRVAFWAYLAPGTSSTVVNGVWQIYVHDFNAVPGTQPQLVSTSAAGAPQGQGDEGSSTITLPAISSDGGFVAFRSRGSGLVAGNVGGVSHVYVKELATGAIVRASVSSTGIPGNGDSSGGGQGYRPGLARLAATVTFTTNATNLAPETGGFFPNVVAHNPRTGQTVGFSASKLLSGLPNITDDGSLLVAYSGYALDPAFPSSNGRGLFTFAGMNELAIRYRLYSPGTYEHLYTTDLNEYNVLPVCCAWVAEGAIYRIFRGAGGSLNNVAAVPYYRLYNPFSYQHHWTTDVGEYNFLPSVGWIKEGVDGYILPTQATGSVPLYRLYLNAAGGLHLWTIDANERNYLVANAGWIDEGIAGYVVPLP